MIGAQAIHGIPVLRIGVPTGNGALLLTHGLVVWFASENGD